MKIKKKLYIQAEKHCFEEDFTISINAHKEETDGGTIVVDIATHELELDIPDVDQNELTLGHIDQLKQMKVKIMADNHLKMQSIDSEIQKLMAIEAK
jgi:hypothetical protein